MFVISYLIVKNIFKVLYKNMRKWWKFGNWIDYFVYNSLYSIKFSLKIKFFKIDESPCKITCLYMADRSIIHKYNINIVKKFLWFKIKKNINKYKYKYFNKIIILYILIYYKYIHFYINNIYYQSIRIMKSSRIFFHTFPKDFFVHNKSYNIITRIREFP